MFFSNDLLSQRESGFGLLWLAATIGSRSTFKKLPRRSILTADISSLCTLIAEPDEPLALRLSSNLMVGVTRVFVAKHDIFMADVNTCFTNLKKAVLELKKVGLASDSLELGTSSVRPDTITLSATVGDGNAFDFEFSLFEPFWAEVSGAELNGTLSLSGGLPSSSFDDVPEEEMIIFEPPTPGMHRNAQSSAGKNNSTTRNNRDQHILNEAHLYDPISDPSFGGINSGQDDGLNWNDILLPDDVNGLGIGDEFDLGLGADAFGDVGLNDGDVFGNPGFDIGSGGFQIQGDDPFGAINGNDIDQLSPSAGRGKKRPVEDLYGDHMGEENRLSLGPDNQSLYAVDGTIAPVDAASTIAVIKPKKIAAKKAIVDPRIELTDAELIASRERYDQDQQRIGQELDAKKKDKLAYFSAMEMIWEPPSIFGASELIDFWKDAYKAQVQAQQRLENTFRSPEPPGKRRKTIRGVPTEETAVVDDRTGLPVDSGFSVLEYLEDPGDRAPLGGGIEFQMDYNGPDLGQTPGDGRESRGGSRGQSMDTPGMARRASSRPPSALGFGSQRSSFLPWDQGAAVSSDIDVGYGLGTIEDLELGGNGEELRMLRGNQEGDKDSYLGRHSRYASGSPAFNLATNGSLDGAAVLGDPASQESNVLNESQLSEASHLANLERNSHNFLEYSKSLLISNGANSLMLTTVAPVAASTPHVAAAAFYHCLVLATKNLIRLKQDAPYEAIIISVL